MIPRETEWQEEAPLILPERAHVSSRPNIRVYSRDTRFYLIAKRTLDIVLSSAALVMLLPFLVVVSAIICLDDPTGGPIFVQDRVGKNGKTFRFLNARSMLEAGYIKQRIRIIKSNLLYDTHKSKIGTGIQTSNRRIRFI